MSHLNPFEFVKAVSQTKEDLLADPLLEKEYEPFFINRALSYYPDTIFHVNELNRFQDIPKREHFLYLLHAVRPRSRYSKWAKHIDSEQVKLASEAYGFSRRKAESAVLALGSRIEELKRLNQRGGQSK